MTPTFADAEKIEAMSDEVRRRGETPPDLLLIFEVQRPRGVDPHRLAAALQNEKMVEWAHVRSKAVPASR
jgi:hypothetical protein